MYLNIGMGRKYSACLYLAKKHGNIAHASRKSRWPSAPR